MGGAVVRALDGVSLRIETGELVALLGASGSGKSTLTKLVQRLYAPDRGRVLVDGHDIGIIDTTSLRHQVGMVLQENMLFNRTVHENIALADPKDGKPTRVGFKMVGDKKVRFAKRSGVEIDG